VISLTSYAVVCSNVVVHNSDHNSVMVAIVDYYRGGPAEDVTVESPLSPNLIASNGSTNVRVDVSSEPSDKSRRESTYTLTSAHDDHAVETCVESFAGDDVLGEDVIPVKLEMTFKERLAFVASLWPFMVNSKLE